jgi:cytochrome c2
MATSARLTPSVWLAAALIALGVCGGLASVTIQGWQSRTRERAFAAELTGGDAGRGKVRAAEAGCGACHEIPGVSRADGKVGPSLSGVAARAFLAGDLPNTPTHMLRWIAHPQEVSPGVGMPDPPITDADARDIAAYLYTLK